MNITKENRVGEIVAEDYRAAEVFKKYNIDFCCNGGRSISDACASLPVTPEQLIKDLQERLVQHNGGEIDFKSWPADLLADYIEKKHHRFVRDQIPMLLEFLQKLCHVHGENHPELIDIYHHFQASAHELTQHMYKEEAILFPFVRKMLQNNTAELELDSCFGSVQNPIAAMMDEHSAEGERFEEIARLSNNYEAPADGCRTYEVTYAMLRDFQEDLHKHIHLENNILFPKAIAMEKTMAG